LFFNPFLSTFVFYLLWGCLALISGIRGKWHVVRLHLWLKSMVENSRRQRL